MKFSTLFPALLVMVSLQLNSREACAQEKTPEQPKLVVGIVVDQMRYDYLTRFYNKFSDGGFKRLISEGYNCKNTNFNYVPTYTAPGHTSIYTGTTPLYHGIVGNDWYDREKGKQIYVTDDETVHTVGSDSKAVGEMSPRVNYATTIGDELRLATNMNSKVISISLKDRASILPGGHLSNGSFWFDGATGKFITSSYYMDRLPQWVEEFNSKGLTEKYLSKPWTTLLPIGKYIESAADDNAYEGLLKGENKPVFPHNLPEMCSPGNYGIIKEVPMGNDITKDMAIAALEHAGLGKGKYTDLLAVSFSSTDYVGHRYGPRSVELEDTYLRLDKDLEELFNALDKNIGKGNYTLFLTADHAVTYIPEELKDLNVDAGYFNTNTFTDTLKADLQEKFGSANLVSYFINNQIYLNHEEIDAQKLNIEEIEKETVKVALAFKGVANAYTANQLDGPTLQSYVGQLLQNGFYRKRCGDVAILLEPQWLDSGSDGPHTGTSHGSAYAYDTHVPLLWYGWHVKAGQTAAPIKITAIAPTVAALLNINAPSACTGTPILPVTE